MLKTLLAGLALSTVVAGALAPAATANPETDASMSSDIKALATGLETAYVDARRYPNRPDGLGDPFMVSESNTTVEAAVFNGKTDKFCIRAHNPFSFQYNGSDTDAYIFYASDGGGLKRGERTGYCKRVDESKFFDWGVAAAKDETHREDLLSLQKAVEAYREDNGSYPRNPQDIKGQYTVTQGNTIEVAYLVNSSNVATKYCLRISAPGASNQGTNAKDYFFRATGQAETIKPKGACEKLYDNDRNFKDFTPQA